MKRRSFLLGAAALPLAGLSQASPFGADVTLLDFMTAPHRALALAGKSDQFDSGYAFRAALAYPGGAVIPAGEFRISGGQPTVIENCRASGASRRGFLST